MTTIKSELAIIPPWAYVPAALLLIGVPVLFMTFVWPGTHDSPTFPFQVLISFLPGTFLGFLMLMVGYVNVDAKRRAMNRTAWTLIVILVPNAIGFIIYFLMRSPIQDNCPQCATMIDSRANFCPACRYNFHPTCDQCKSAVQQTDKYCAKCGAEVKAA